MPLKLNGERWIDVGGVRTRYFEVGAGTPILFVHGGQVGDESFAGSAQDWEFSCLPMADSGYRAIAVDLLGQGYTDNPSLDEDWSPRAQVAHLAQFIRALGSGPVHIVGHSHGGYVACQVTQQHPELITSCVIVSSDNCAPGTSRAEVVFATNPYEPGSRQATAWQLQRSSFGDDHITSDWLDHIQTAIGIDKHKTRVRKMKADGLVDLVFAVDLRRDRDAMFARLKHSALLRPVLLIWGFNDPIAPVEMGYRLVELLGRHQPRVQLSIVNKAGHFCHRERPAEVNRVLLEFFEGVAHGV